MDKTIKELPIYISDGNYSSKYPRSEEFVEKGIPFIRANNLLNGDITDDDMYYITPEKHDILQKGHVKTGDVLITTRGNIGQVGIVPDRHNDSNINAQIVLLRVDNKTIFNRYLLWALQSKRAKEQYQSLQTGTALKQLPVGRLEQIKIKIVELEKQYSIANNLDRVQNIIQLRKQQLQQLDELVKARFVELFGDCKNRVRLGDCCDVHARIGWQALTKNEHMKTGEYMLVTGTDFKDGEINYSTCVYVAKERYEMDKHIVLKNDDVLITKDGTIGKVAVVHNLPKPATLNAGVFVVRPDDRFNKTFIANVFRGTLFSDFVEDSKTGATIKHLNQKHLVEFMIPVPSINEQETFATFVKQIDKLKFVVQKALDEAQMLFDSLMQEYFK